MPKYDLHDVFLSYRRYEDKDRTDDQGTKIADAIYKYLHEKRIAVFLDRPEMETGSFDDQLQWQLEHCPNYIYIATEDARHFRQVTPPEKDYVAEEVRFAYKTIKAQEHVDNQRRDRVVLPIIPFKSKTQINAEKQGITLYAEPYPVEVQSILSSQQAVVLHGEMPTTEDLEQILKYVTAVNRGNMWNAGYRWLKQAKEHRFSGLTINDTLIPQAGKHEEVRFPINVTQSGKEECPLIDVIKNTNDHLYLIGSGGIGKTTALLRIMEEAYDEDRSGNVERNRLEGQVPLFIELSRAPDYIPPNDEHGRKWQVYQGGKSTFIHREIYCQFRRDLKLRQIPDSAVEQIDEIYSADYDVAVKPIVNLFSGTEGAPEYILLLDGLNEVSRREIRQSDEEGGSSYKCGVISMVLNEIRDILKYKNVRVIFTSRSKEAANWTENITLLDLSGVNPDTIEEYLQLSQVPQTRIDTALHNEKLSEVLRIPLFLIMYAKLGGEDELLTAGEIMRRFYHQRNDDFYNQKLRSEDVQVAVQDSSEGYVPIDRVTPAMLGFILDFILPDIAWAMSKAEQFKIYRDQLGNDPKGLDGIIEHVLIDQSDECICGKFGGYVFTEYAGEVICRPV